MSVVSLAEYKSFLGIPDTDFTQDKKIADLMAAVEGFFQSYTSRRLYTTPIVKLMDGTGTNTLVFPYRPVQSVTMIEVLNIVQGLNVKVYTPPDIRFDPKNGRMVLIPSQDLFFSVITQLYNAQGDINHIPFFPKGKQNIRVTYTAGYAAGAVPPEVKYCLKKIMAYFMSDELIGAASKKTLGKLSIDIERQIMPYDLKLILNGYRRIYI